MTMLLVYGFTVVYFYDYFCLPYICTHTYVYICISFEIIHISHKQHLCYTKVV